MQRVIFTIFLTLSLSACGSSAASETPQGNATEASSVPEARPIRGMRAIDRARDASALASERALRHDTIR
jgi:hypothetical protein